MGKLGVFIVILGFIGFSSVSYARNACVIKRGDERKGLCYETNRKCVKGYKTHYNQPCLRKGAYRCNTGVLTFYMYSPISGYLRDGNSYYRYIPFNACSKLKRTVSKTFTTSRKNACVITKGVETVGLCYESNKPCKRKYRTFRNQPCQRKGAYRCDTKIGSYFMYSPTSGSVRIGNTYKTYNGYSACRDFKRSISKKRKW